MNESPSPERNADQSSPEALAQAFWQASDRFNEHVLICPDCHGGSRRYCETGTQYRDQMMQTAERAPDHLLHRRSARSSAANDNDQARQPATPVVQTRTRMRPDP